MNDTVVRTHPKRRRHWLVLLILGPILGAAVLIVSAVLIPDRFDHYVGGIDPNLILFAVIVSGFLVAFAALFVKSGLAAALIAGALFAGAVLLSMQLLMSGHPCC